MKMLSLTLLMIMLGIMRVNAVTVDLSNQNLTHVTREHIDDNATEIVLADNIISEVHDHDFANLLELKILNMRLNKIHTVSKLAFVNSSRVKQLDFGINELSCVCDLSFPELNLVNVNLEENPIGVIQPDDLKGFHSIYTLNLKATGIVSFPNCTYIGDTLGYIIFNKNNLVTIDPELLATAPKLQMLELSATKLTSVPDFSTFPGRFNLEYLNFNYIWKIGQTLAASDFDDLPVLKIFYLEYSSLSEFPDFGSAKATLEEIHLTGNQIGNVEPTRLQGMPRLLKLVLAQNLLTSFPDVLALGLGLQKLDLGKNQLICDDTTRWIGDALEKQVIEKFRVDDPCYVAPERQSKLFTRQNLGAGSPDDDKLAVCVCLCLLDPSCVAVSFKPTCVLEQQLPTLPASQQWWIRNM